MPLPRAFGALAVLSLALALAGCGDDCDDGDLYVSNRTDSTTNEAITEFRVAEDGVPLGGNWLAAPILPGDVDFILNTSESFYDATATLELGGFVDWFNFFIGDCGSTVLEAF